MVVFTGIPKVDYVLAQPEVLDALANPRINRRGQVPLVAGADKRDLRLTHIDERVPRAFPRPDGGSYAPDPYLHKHEVTERWVMENGAKHMGALGLSPDDFVQTPDGPKVGYAKAHYDFAVPSEAAEVAADGIPPRLYNSHMAGTFAGIKGKTADASPPTLYDRPYRDDGVTGLLTPAKGKDMDYGYGGLLGNNPAGLLGGMAGLFGGGYLGGQAGYNLGSMFGGQLGQPQPDQQPQPSPTPPQPSLGPVAQPSTSYGPGVGYGQQQPGSFPSGLNISPPQQPMQLPDYGNANMVQTGPQTGPQDPVSNTDPSAAAAALGGGGQPQTQSGGGFFGPQNADILSTLGGALLQAPTLRQGLGIAGQQLPGVLRQSRANNATVDWLTRNQNIDPQTRALYMANPQIAQAVAEAQLVPHTKQFVQDYSTGEIYVGDPMTGQMTKAVGNEGGLTEEAVDAAADRALAGDTTALQNIGRGTQGAHDIRRITNRMYEKAAQQGISGADVARKVAEFQGTKAGERVFGQREAQVAIASNEASQMADQALEASAAVPRTQFVPWNKAVQAVQSGTSDPKLAQFVAATNALVNTYARAITPTGTPRVSDKEHAYEMLNVAQSPEAYAAVVFQMKREMRAAIKSAADRGQFNDLSSGQPAAPADGAAAATPAAAPAAGGVISLQDWLKQNP